MSITLQIDEVNRETLAKAEAEIIAQTMVKNRYNQAKTARQLGISRTTLRTKLKAAYDDWYVGTRG